MTAVVYRTENQHLAPVLLERMRAETGRQSGQMLSFKKMNPEQKLASASRIGAAHWLRVISVVVCKEHLLDSLPQPNLRYLYTFRLLLERISWLAASRRELAEYTLAHITKFKKEALEEYEAKLRRLDTAIDWQWLDPNGGKLDQPRRIEQLQMADTAASATGAAFNAHQRTGETDTSYLMAMRDALWVPPGRNLTSYGLKMHPWSRAEVRAAYPWVAAL